MNNLDQAGELIVTNPGFPNPFDGGSNTQVLPLNISLIAEDLVNPSLFIAQTAANYRLNKYFSIDGTYTFKNGRYHFRSRDINAPIANQRPNFNFGRMNMLESSGMSREQVLAVRVNSFVKKINIFAKYELGFRKSNFSSALALPTNSLDLNPDHGRSDLDQRHKVSVGLDFTFHQLKFSPTLKLDSGFPYSIATGRDDNGDTIYNDRPPNVPRNREVGAWNRNVDLAINWAVPKKYIKLGRKENIAKVYITMLNLLNSSNFSTYSGIQTSPNYLRPITSKPARSIEMGLTYTF